MKEGKNYECFFDTSSLFKLYHKEEGTEELLDFFNNERIDSIYLANIATIEFCSVVWKKCRKKDINEQQANFLIKNFNKDKKNYNLVPFTDRLRNISEQLIGKHWKTGLRTLDSIQLASGLIIKSEIEYYFTSDIILTEIAKLEGLKIKLLNCWNSYL